MKLLVATVAAWSAFGCGPSVHEVQQQQMARTVEALQAQLVRYDARIEDLNNQVVVLEDRVERAVRAPSEDAAPALEVVRLVPEALEPLEAPVDDGPPVEISMVGNRLVERRLVGEVAPPPALALRRAPKSKAKPRRERRVHPPSRDVLADASFSAALRAYGAGRTSEAHQGFSVFLKHHGAHDKAIDARFWLGVCEFERGEYQRAVASFQKVVSSRPGSSKAPDALLKMGLAYERMSNATRARRAFEGVVKDYPDSAVAELARARIALAARWAEGGTR